MKRRILILLLVALLVPAHHAVALSFKASFGSIHLTARPGQVVTSKFSLTLDAKEETTRFRAVVEDWWPSDDGRQSFYAKAGTLERSCGPWVVLNPVEAEISGGDTLTVRLTISVSPQAQAGGYWCALTLNEIPTPGSVVGGSGVKFKASVSTGVFINIAPVERNVAILGIDHTPDATVVTVQNTGNVPVTVKGHVEYRRAGVEKPILSVPINSGALLTERTVIGTFRAPFAAGVALLAGVYQVRAVLDIDADEYIAADADVTVAATPPKEMLGQGRAAAR